MNQVKTKADEAVEIFKLVSVHPETQDFDATKFLKNFYFS